MDHELKSNLCFAMQREMLLMLLKSKEITIEEYEKTVSKLRTKHNCKLIVTSANMQGFALDF